LVPRGIKPAIDISTHLPRPAEEVWGAVSKPAGVNAELMPLVRMTFPAGAPDINQAPIGVPAAICWLLAGGVLPFDRHVLVFADIGPSGFIETSHSLMHHQWKHERSVRPDGEGCVVRDIVTVTPRLAILQAPTDAIAAWVFHHRHKRLKLLYS
jgi:ligand-binding SRPBCC domain-containing protein